LIFDLKGNNKNFKYNLDCLAGLASLDAALDEARPADAEVGGTAEAIQASLGAVGLADVPLVLVLHISCLALALVVAHTYAVEARHVTLRQTLAQLPVPLEAGSALTDVRANAASVLAGSKMVQRVIKLVSLVIFF